MHSSISAERSAVRWYIRNDVLIGPSSSTSESPFSSYFKTNDAPSVVEVDGIAALITDRGEAASEIRARLERLAKEAQVLQGQLDKHTHYISKHQPITSAFRRLPDAALVRIFLASRSNARPSPIAISHVSHQWRKLALDTPALWTGIGVHILEKRTTPEREGSKHALEGVSAYIERSGELGLSIQVTADPIKSSSPEEARSLHEALVAILEPTVSRWTDLHVNVPPDSPLMRLLQIQAASVPALQSLSIRFEPVFRFSKDETPSAETLPIESMINVWTASSLTTLSLRDMGKSLIEANVALPVSRSTLTYLSLRPSRRAHLAKHHVVPILAACTSLVECSLTLFDAFGYDQFPESLEDVPAVEATLPNLSVLHLHGSEVIMRGLAAQLTLPSLTTLITLFDRASYPADEGKSALVEWLDRFGHQLLVASFDYVTLTQSALAYCLARLPNVVDLRMVGRAMWMLWTFISIKSLKSAGPPSAIIDDNILESLKNRDDYCLNISLCHSKTRLKFKPVVGLNLLGYPVCVLALSDRLLKRPGRYSLTLAQLNQGV